MLLRTFEKVSTLFDAAGGYMSTAELKKNKITTIQINELIKSGHIEKVSHGIYWWVDKKGGKPENYKLLETSRVNPDSIICTASALYYYGILKDEPEALTVATARTDRSQMKLPFSVSRHYFSDAMFDEYSRTVETENGAFKIYSPERSLCDCLRLTRDDALGNLQDLIISYNNYEGRDSEALLAYAEAAGLSAAAKKLLSDSGKSPL